MATVNGLGPRSVGAGWFGVFMALASLGCASSRDVRAKVEELAKQVQATRTMVLDHQSSLDGELGELRTQVATIQRSLNDSADGERGTLDALRTRIAELEVARKRQFEILDRLSELEKRSAPAATDATPSSLADWYRRKAVAIDLGRVQTLARVNSSAP